MQWHWAVLLSFLGVFIRHHWRGYFKSSWTWFSSSKGNFSLLQTFSLVSGAWDSFLKASVARKDWGKKNIENLRLFCVFCWWQQMGLLSHLEAGTHIPSFSFFCLCTSRSPSCSLSPVVFFSSCAYPVYGGLIKSSFFIHVHLLPHWLDILLIELVHFWAWRRINQLCSFPLLSRAVFYEIVPSTSEQGLWSCCFLPCLLRILKSAISWSLQSRLLLTFTGFTSLTAFF